MELESSNEYLTLNMRTQNPIRLASVKFMRCQTIDLFSDFSKIMFQLEH